MIIGDFYVEGVPCLPLEADAPLLVDADAVLPLAIAREFLQAVRRRNAQVVQIGGGGDAVEAHLGALLDFDRESARVLALENALRLLIRTTLETRLELLREMVGEP